ncbi:MAG: amidohydrolase family protein [Roseibium sp.]
MIVDAHQHFWKIDRGDYFWMDDSVAEIRRDILPADLLPHANTCGVTASIAVQAAPTVAETEYLLDLAKESNLVQGVVGWVDLENAHVATTLSRLATSPDFKGIRPMLQDIEDTNWILKPNVLANLSIVSNLGLTLDALVQPRHLATINEVATKLPSLKIVIDHCAKPAIAGGKNAGDDWRSDMSRLADHDQIYCKLSGLANEYGNGWSAETLKPVFDHVMETFGANRIMWGSDWPVLELSGTYEDWFSCAQSLASGMTEQDRLMVFGGTACDFYRIQPS